LLDDLPADLCDRAAQVVLARPQDFWVDRAKMQLEATRLRLALRRYYSVLIGPIKGQLQLPPTQNITVETPARMNLDGHDLVVAKYKMAGTLLTDRDSPLIAEEALVDIGGTWDEPILLPIDPDLLLQRTDYACTHAGHDEPNSIDAENT